MYFNCKNCTDRKLGCHGVCEDYIKISKERAEKRKKDRMSSTYNPVRSIGSVSTGTRMVLRKDIR